MSHIYSNSLPSRVRVLVLGGGIHGVGVLHDMATRGWKDIFLVEKNTLGSGTSSRSTKLLHGGLRYLQDPRNFGLVASALQERSNLLKLAPDLSSPMEFYLPVLKKGGMPGFILGTGLFLYDFLAGKYKIGSYKKVPDKTVIENVPFLQRDITKSVYAYWDVITDDLALVRRVAASAVNLGAKIAEHTEVVKITPDEDGWLVDVKQQDGSIETISARYVVNAMGPWANVILEQSNIKPVYKGVNSKGIHLLVDNIGHKTSLFLQSPEDGRIFFVVPWKGHTLIGTTETEYNGDLDDVRSNDEDIKYLLDKCSLYLNRPITEANIKAHFAGLRWLPVSSDTSLGKISREHVIGENRSRSGVLYTIYGGKLTTYRRLAESIGDSITKRFESFKPSRTGNKDTWVDKSQMPKYDDNVLERFHF